MTEINEILNFELFSFNTYSFKLNMLFFIIVIIFITKFILWIIKKVVKRKIEKSEHERGDYLAIYKLIKYFIWIIAIGFMFEVANLKLTVLLAGSAALLVGIGMGLQQTFNDIISGVILLTEGTTKVEDILEIENDIVVVQSIGLRTSKVINRDDIVIIVPNSLITTSKVVNWSHQSNTTRFRINIGVAYGSDVDLVIKILEESAKINKEVSKDKNVKAIFTDFGNSSLDFQLMFYSENNFRIEMIKSEIRKNINKKFKENNIKIPFPQMDVHMKT